MLGMDLATVRDVALAIAVAAVLLAVVGAFVIKVVVSKLIVVGLLLAVAGVVWQQRGDVVACAGEVGSTLAAGAVDDTTCTFFGRDVTVDGPLG